MARALSTFRMNGREVWYKPLALSATGASTIISAASGYLPVIVSLDLVAGGACGGWIHAGDGEAIFGSSAAKIDFAASGQFALRGRYLGRKSSSIQVTLDSTGPLAGCVAYQYVDDDEYQADADEST